MFRVASLALLTLAAMPAAQASDVYMWGVGPRIGTNFIPGAYPVAFPRRVAESYVDGTEGTDDPIPVIDKVRGDFVFGAEAMYYVDGGSRLGMVAGFDVGSRFFDAHVIAKYNRVIQSASVDFLFGGGAGFGTQRWKGEGEGRLRVPYFPLRAEVSGMIRADTMAFQLTPYFQYNLQANHFYRNDLGEDIDVRGGFYPTVGLEFSVLFGDFEPPKPRKR